LKSKRKKQKKEERKKKERKRSRRRRRRGIRKRKLLVGSTHLQYEFEISKQTINDAVQPREESRFFQSSETGSKNTVTLYFRNPHAVFQNNQTRRLHDGHVHHIHWRLFGRSVHIKGHTVTV
jgi:hypothetical protein